MCASRVQTHRNSVHRPGDPRYVSCRARCAKSMWLRAWYGASHPLRDMGRVGRGVAVGGCVAGWMGGWGQTLPCLNRVWWVGLRRVCEQRLADLRERATRKMALRATGWLVMCVCVRMRDYVTCVKEIVRCGYAICMHIRTVWPSGLRRWIKAPVRKGVGSNPTAVIVHSRWGERRAEGRMHCWWGKIQKKRERDGW